MNEYLDKKNKGLVGDPVEEKHRTRLVSLIGIIAKHPLTPNPAIQSNVFEVSVNLFAQDITVTLPQEIYDWKNAVAASIPELQLNLRLHDYFMGLSYSSTQTMWAYVNLITEMSLNIPPITIYDHKSLDIATSRRYTSIPSEGLLLIEGKLMTLATVHVICSYCLQELISWQIDCSDLNHILPRMCACGRSRLALYVASSTPTCCMACWHLAGYSVSTMKI